MEGHGIASNRIAPEAIDEDVEGHGANFRVLNAQEPSGADDVEGHGFGRGLHADDEDIEGHGTSRPVAPEATDDVEGHGVRGSF